MNPSAPSSPASRHPTRIAVPLVSTQPPLCEQVQAAMAAGADVIELRVDRIGDVAAVETLLSRPHDVPFILTIRSAEEGGAWTGDESERIALLARLAALRPGYVDVEWTTWDRSEDVRQRMAGLCGPGSAINRLILSYHDTRGTPAKLDEIFERLTAVPGAIIKAVFTARDATNACRVLAQLRQRAPQRDVIALAMGAAGLMTRVLARQFGAFLTYATLSEGGESAPGQPTIATLRGLYRYDQIGADTAVYGVVGWPVTHSQSPRLHNAALAADEIDGVYLPLPVGPKYADFAAFLDDLTANAWLAVRGLSVTIPHKEHALRWLVKRRQIVTELAQRCGAVNTLTRVGPASWEGDNTDAPGALAALQTIEELAGDGLHGRSVDVLGAGGVARAVIAALLEHGCQVTTYNRTPVRARALAQQLRCGWRPWKERTHCAGEILINCTSVGLWPDVDASPMPPDGLRPGTVVFDTIYNPPETRLLRDAQARGCRVVPGAAMFIGQAARQYERWHGRPLRLPAAR